ncbi:hypothetical protein [Salinicoccus halodurans]|uniref:Phage protein n=1 Tax=Salinicoccus halodurans TaxID=407035 RepID=A0A0F7HKG7_9STAP|nr:hypothetical protein [Salinicoccus halodurans]AKG74396.1 hypothetical protein AAT16_09215 [Salinicoccus halodurans]SFK95420.1 hypothetical protein SAMN05216235_2742 [Salinicoccus halodurans]
MNLKEETIEVLKENNKNISDIKWIGNKRFTIPHDEDLSILDVDYDDGFGSARIAEDLMLVGDGFWLERHEYDGSEWWEYKELVKKPEEEREYTKVAGGMWNSLEELNEKEEME